MVCRRPRQNASRLEVSCTAPRATAASTSPVCVPQRRPPRDVAANTGDSEQVQVDDAGRGMEEEREMSSMIKRIPGSPTVPDLPDLPDWDEAGFPH
ncbi:hypothetical protein GCM10022232_90080 [Streptomyces plumbiresistens]|uniref:Uncharacterized protein n=1 Tax=Streptomyces plumbiresistens TaxID=511811 RepID=A0ABP7TRH8_9ACTN